MKETLKNLVSKLENVIEVLLDLAMYPSYTLKTKKTRILFVVLFPLWLVYTISLHIIIFLVWLLWKIVSAPIKCIMYIFKSIKKWINNAPL